MSKTDYKSPMKIIRNNERLRRERLTKLIVNNFTADDFFITLNYSAAHQRTIPEAKKTFNKYIQQLKETHGGIELKHIKATRTGKKGRITHYLITSRLVSLHRIRTFWRYSDTPPKIKTLIEEVESGVFKRAFLPDESCSFKIFERAYTGSRNLKRK